MEPPETANAAVLPRADEGVVLGGNGSTGAVVVLRSLDHGRRVDVPPRTTAPDTLGPDPCSGRGRRIVGGVVGTVPTGGAARPSALEPSGCGPVSDDGTEAAVVPADAASRELRGRAPLGLDEGTARRVRAVERGVPSV